VGGARQRGDRVLHMGEKLNLWKEVSMEKNSKGGRHDLTQHRVLRIIPVIVRGLST